VNTTHHPPPPGEPAAPPEPLERRAGRLLAAAAERLARHGWRQGDYWPDSHEFAPYVEGDPCCALGALGVADHMTTSTHLNAALHSRAALAVAVDTLLAEINQGRAGHEHVTDVAAWNDDPARTAGEVIAVMRAAAHRILTDLGEAERLADLSGVPSVKNAHQTGPVSTANHQRSTSEESLADE
jgi:hypothetical protein